MDHFSTLLASTPYGMESHVQSIFDYCRCIGVLKNIDWNVWVC